MGGILYSLIIVNDKAEIVCWNTLKVLELKIKQGTSANQGLLHIFCFWRVLALSHFTLSLPIDMPWAQQVYGTRSSISIFTYY